MHDCLQISQILDPRALQSCRLCDGEAGRPKDPPGVFERPHAPGTNPLPFLPTYSARSSTLMIFRPHCFANRQQSSLRAMEPSGSVGCTSSHSRPAGGKFAR